MFRESTDLRQFRAVGGEFVVGRDAVGHLSVVELFVGDHIEVAGAGQTENDGCNFVVFALKWECKMKILTIM